MKSEQREDLKKHPIQLVFLGVKELFIKANVPPSKDSGAEFGESDVSLSGGASNYDEKNHQIHIVVKLEVGRGAEGDKKSSKGKDSNSPPYEMRIELIGIFEVDESRFDKKEIAEWARHASIFVLSPFIREYAYSLSQKAGFNPLIMPFVEVPTFNYSAKT